MPKYYLDSDQHNEVMGIIFKIYIVAFYHFDKNPFYSDDNARIDALNLPSVATTGVKWTLYSGQ